MNRVERSKEKFQQLFGEGVAAAYTTDPDFQDILSHFIFGEVFYQGNLDDKIRELITLVVLATNQTLPQLKAHVHAALNVGLTSVEIKEAIYQCTPYIGFPKTLNAINEVNEVFMQGISLYRLKVKTLLMKKIVLTKELECRYRYSVMSLKKCGKMPQITKSIYRIISLLFALVISIPVVDLI